MSVLRGFVAVSDMELRLLEKSFVAFMSRAGLGSRGRGMVAQRELWGAADPKP